MEKLDNQDISTDILQGQKALVGLYCKGLIESSCPNMRKLLTDSMTECAQDQFSVFEWMSDNGYYPTENAPAQKVSQEKDKYKQSLADME